MTDLLTAGSISLTALGTTPITIELNGADYEICLAAQPTICETGSIPGAEEGTSGDDVASPVLDGERYNGLAGMDTYMVDGTHGNANFTGGDDDDTLIVSEDYTGEVIFQDM